MMSLLTTAILATTVMNATADDLPFYIPPSPWIPSYSYAFKGASSILREQGEKLLLMNGESLAYRTDHVIVLVNKGHEEVYKELRKLVQERWGIFEEFDNSEHPIPQPSDKIVRNDLDWPILGEGLSRLDTERGSISPREYQLTSRPYNQVTSINGHSQVVIRVTDAAGLLGSEATILQLTRSDWAREWARSSFHGLFPLPYKEDRASLGVVTSTEITLVEDLKSGHTGTEIHYFVSQGPPDAEFAKTLLRKMRDGID